MAVHHETKGSVEGFDIWCEWSEHSGKFDEKDARRVWKSFKDRTRNPCRMPTIIQAAGRNRFALSFAEDDFADLDDDGEELKDADCLSDILGPSPGDHARPLGHPLRFRRLHRRREDGRGPASGPNASR